MSESRRSRACRQSASRALLAVSLLAVSLLAAPTVGAAQASTAAADRALADSLTRARVTAQLARDSAVAVVEALQKVVSDRRNQYFNAGGRRVRFSTTEVTDADTAAVAAGLRMAEAMLRERLGEDGLALIDTSTWVLSSRPLRGLGATSVAGYVMVAFNEKPFSMRSHLRRPVKAEDVAPLALRLAGEGIAARRAVLAPFGGITIDADPLTFELAAREMALSWAASGRDCAAGAVSACITVLTPRSERDPAPPWFAREDARAVVTAAQMPGLPDSAFSAMRRTCLREDESVCPAVLERLVAPDPFSGNLRGSIASHALALGGPASLDRLAEAPDGSALDVLAFVAGVTPDSLVLSWRARVTAALDASRPSPVPSALTAIAWCALFLGLAMRRRPA